MAHQFTKTTKTGLGSRLIGAIKGIFIGILLFVISFGLLYWNEGRVDVSEVAKNAVEIDADQIDAGADDSFVYVSGEVVSQEQIGDGLYLIPGDYLAVSRTVEMYAWVEKTSSTTEDEWGGGQTTETTYSYAQEWVHSPTSSSGFEYPEDHSNPSKTIEDDSNRVGSAKIGVYGLDMGKLELAGYRNLSLSEDVIDTSKLGAASVETDAAVDKSSDDEDFSYEWSVTVDEEEVAGNTTNESGSGLVGDFIFVGEGSLTSPEVGDLRISYSVVRNNTEGTIFAELDGDRLVTYVDEDTEESLYRMFTGTRDEALGTMHGEYKFMLWLFRAIGFVMMWVGLSSLFGPVVIFLGIVPALGSLSRSIVSFVTFIVAALLSIITILISMILHSVIALVVAVVLTLVVVVYFLKRESHGKSILKK
jgi:Transmembrane protein 43